MILQEKALFGDKVLEIELHEDGRYRLRCGGVEYADGRRTLRGRTTPYAFRSVEQLRYDFEKDLPAA